MRVELTGHISLLLALAWRNLWRQRKRTLMTLSAIVIAVASMVLLGTFMRAWGLSTLDETLDAMNGSGQIHRQNYLENPTIDQRMAAPTSALKQALNQPLIKQWAGRVRLPGMIRSERENLPVMVFGIDPAREKGLSFIGKGVSQGAMLDNDSSKGVILGEKMLKRLQTKLGRRVVLMAQGSTGDIQELGAKIIGVYTSNPEMEKSTIFVSLRQSQDWLKMGADITELSYRLVDPVTTAQALSVQKNIKHLLIQEDLPLDIKRWDELQPYAKAMMEMSQGMTGIWILVSFAMVSFGLVNTLLMAVYERMREFGLLQALGMTPRWMLLQILIESTFLVGIAVLVGLLLGAGVVMSFHSGISLGEGANYFGAAKVIYLKLDLNEMITIGFGIWGLGILISLYPASRAAKTVPVEVLSRTDH